MPSPGARCLPIPPAGRSPGDARSARSSRRDNACRRPVLRWARFVQEAQQLRLLHVLRRKHGRVLEPRGELHGQLDFEIHRREPLVGEDSEGAVPNYERGALLAGQDCHHGRRAVAVGTSWATSRASCVGLNGFSTVASAPAARARSGVSTSRNSVIITTGGFGESALSRAKGSPSGRLESRSTRSGWIAAAASRTVAALDSQRTWCPSRSSLKTMIDAILGSSSTSKTRAMTRH